MEESRVDEWLGGGGGEAGGAADVLCCLTTQKALYGTVRTAQGNPDLCHVKYLSDIKLHFE